MSDPGSDYSIAGTAKRLGIAGLPSNPVIVTPTRVAGSQWTVTLKTAVVAHLRAMSRLPLGREAIHTGIARQCFGLVVDTMGNNVHVVYDRPLPEPQEQRDPPPVFSIDTDAFGVRLDKGSQGHAGMFGWQGKESSVTDGDIGLIYMQNRHYDASLGRFIQADTVLVASLTTQGMNRYIYKENDPVNHSDPTGRIFGLAFLLGIMLGGILALLQTGVPSPGSFAFEHLITTSRAT